MKSLNVSKEFNGKTVVASVLERYAPLYIKEGWVVVSDVVEKNKLAGSVIVKEEKKEELKLKNPKKW